MTVWIIKIEYPGGYTSFHDKWFEYEEHCYQFLRSVCSTDAVFNYNSGVVVDRGVTYNLLGFDKSEARCKD